MLDSVQPAGLMLNTGLTCKLPVCESVLVWKIRVALAMSVELIVGGNADRSNLTRALLRLLTVTALAAPALAAAICTSTIAGASTAWAEIGARPATRKAALIEFKRVFKVVSC